MPEGENFLEVGGEKIPMPADFKSTGKIGVLEMLASFTGKYYNSVDEMLNELVDKILKGDTHALVGTIVVSIAGIFIILIMLNIIGGDNTPKPVKKVVEPIVLRDFTIEQLREYDGGDEEIDEKSQKRDDLIPIYVAMKGKVYDVSSSRAMYGKGSGYHCFAGREATRAMAKFSFEEADLADPYRDSDFGLFEKNTLDEWIMKFDFKYPIVGKVSTPPKDMKVTRIEFDQKVKDGSFLQKSDNRIDMPLYIILNKQIIDVSYGGMSFYGNGGPYHIFAWKDISYALATMSLKPEDVEKSHIQSDVLLNTLTKEQAVILKDWKIKFIEKKKYPVVGQIV